MLGLVSLLLDGYFVKFDVSICPFVYLDYMSKLPTPCCSCPCALLFIWAFVVPLGRLTFATSLSGSYLLDVALVGDFGFGRSFMLLLKEQR